MMVFPDKEQVTWTICHLLSISALQCHYIKSIATINFSNLTFTKLYAHGTNYHLVKKNVLCNWYFIRAVHHWNLLPKRTSCVIGTLSVQYITGIFCQMNVVEFLHPHNLDRQLWNIYGLKSRNAVMSSIMTLAPLKENRIKRVYRYFCLSI